MLNVPQKFLDAQNIHIYLTQYKLTKIEILFISLFLWTTKQLGTF